MTDLRDMELLVALALHKHFARAAEACQISQPAFSARINRMEQDLGVQIVHRGNRFQGFTTEGELVLSWARRLLKDRASMLDELQAEIGQLTGTISLGVVPTALTFASRIPLALGRDHPGLVLRLISASSTTIQNGLQDHTLDAGITYTDGALDPHFVSDPLYEETYVLLCPPPIAPRLQGNATWSEAATLPLCLLTHDMQNRRILDGIFADLGFSPEPVIETNAFTAALGQLNEGMAATIVPAHMAQNVPKDVDVVTLPLTGPDVAKPIGLVTTGFDPTPLPIAALRAATISAAR